MRNWILLFMIVTNEVQGGSSPVVEAEFPGQRTSHYSDMHLPEGDMVSFMLGMADDLQRAPFGFKVQAQAALEKAILEAKPSTLKQLFGVMLGLLDGSLSKATPRQSSVLFELLLSTAEKMPLVIDRIILSASPSQINRMVDFLITNVAYDQDRKLNRTIFHLVTQTDTENIRKIAALILQSLAEYSRPFGQWIESSRTVFWDLAEDKDLQQNLIVILTELLANSDNDVLLKVGQEIGESTFSQLPYHTRLKIIRALLTPNNIITGLTTLWDAVLDVTRIRSATLGISRSQPGYFIKIHNRAAYTARVTIRYRMCDLCKVNESVSFFAPGQKANVIRLANTSSAVDVSIHTWIWGDLKRRLVGQYTIGRTELLGDNNEIKITTLGTLLGNQSRCQLVTSRGLVDRSLSGTAVCKKPLQ